MKKFAFKLDGICDAVLGRVSEIPNGDSNHFRFVGGNVPELLSRQNPHLSLYDVPATVLPIKTADNSVLKLNLGDVVLFGPSGTCTIEYESHSYSNSIFLTEKCNSKCVMCAQPPKTCSDSTPLARALIELIDSPPDCIGITGGEPTLAGDELLQVLHRCRERFPTTTIQLLSNARLLRSYEKAEALAGAGGDHLMVCVPLYCDISKIHDAIVGANGAFWETVEGIYNLERFNIPVEIRTVVQKLNYRRLPQWSEFIYRFFPFVSHVAIMGLEPIGLALQNIKSVWIDPLDYACCLDASIKILHRGDLKISLYNHQLCTLPRHLWSFSKKSISEWKNVFFEECYKCSEKSNCAGFFAASSNKWSRGIKAIKLGGENG